jgi:hypothetical protein
VIGVRLGTSARPVIVRNRRQAQVSRLPLVHRATLPPTPDSPRVAPKQ